MFLVSRLWCTQVAACNVGRFVKNILVLNKSFKQFHVSASVVKVLNFISG